MHLQTEEQLDLWTAVHPEQSARADTEFQELQELDTHFAEVESWHAELSLPEVNRPEVNRPEVSDPEVDAELVLVPGYTGHTSDHVADHMLDASSPAHKSLCRVNGTASKLGENEIQALRKQLVAERELHAQLAEKLVVENQELLLLKESVKDREQRLEADLQRLATEQCELAQRQSASEEHERNLKLQEEQWCRATAEREQALDCRNESLDDQQRSLEDQQRSLEELRCQLEERAAWLEREAERLAEAQICLQQQAAREDEPLREAVVEGTASVPESNGTDHANDVPVVFEQMSLEEMADDAADDTMADTMADDAFAFDSMIDRIAVFHRQNDKKWYQFWR